MQETYRPAIGYALNAFPCESFADWWTCLNTDVLAIKQRVCPDEILPLELRFSEQFIRELTPGRIRQLKTFFAAQGLALVTVNAFVMPHFHGAPVKERAYLPAWHASDARLNFTNRCVELLEELECISVEVPKCSSPQMTKCRSAEVPKGSRAESELRHLSTWALATPPSIPPSVSVPFGALKPVTLAAVAPNIIKAGEFAARHGCVIALEPEPGLCVETTEEVLEFFSAYVPQELRPYLGVNFDLAHQLVEFEKLPAALAALKQHGITVAKIHVSNAAEMTELKPFYNDSIYLHQVTGCDAAGRRSYFALDWPATTPAGIAKYRCHYHLPVFPTALQSTLAEVEAFLRKLGPQPAPLIIETYTWPEQLRGRQHLVDNICRELEWVRQVTNAG